METIQANVTGKKPTAEPRDAPKARRVLDACRAVGISRSTLYRLAAEGKIKLIRIGGRTLVPEAELDRLANEGTA